MDESLYSVLAHEMREQNFPDLTTTFATASTGFSYSERDQDLQEI
jgi:hypothetical protein